MDQVSTKCRGAAALSALCLPVRALTVAEMADRLGVKRQAVYAWLDGSSRPRLEIAVRIEREFGIPVVDWADLPDDDPAPHAPADAMVGR